MNFMPKLQTFLRSLQVGWVTQLVSLIGQRSVPANESSSILQSAESADNASTLSYFRNNGKYIHFATTTSSTNRLEALPAPFDAEPDKMSLKLVNLHSHPF